MAQLTLNPVKKNYYIYGREIPECIEGLKLVLRESLDNRKNLEQAIISFKLLFRLINYKIGRPKYPKNIDWNVISKYLEQWEEVNYF